MRNYEKNLNPSEVALFAPASNVDITSDTTITLTQPYSPFRFLIFFLSGGNSNTRSIIIVPTSQLGAGAFYSLTRGSENGNVRISTVTEVGEVNPSKIRFMSTTLNPLYVFRVYGTN